MIIPQQCFQEYHQASDIFVHLNYIRRLLPVCCKKKALRLSPEGTFYSRTSSLLTSVGFKTFVFSLGFVHFLGNLHGISLATLGEHFVIELVEFLVFGLGKLNF